MRPTIHQHPRFVRVAAAFAFSICGICVFAGCNSNESGGHHVMLTDFGTGKDSDTLFPRRDVGTEQTVAATTPAAKTPEVKTPVVKETVPEKPAAETPVPETTVAEKPVAAKPVAEAPAAEKPAEEKPVAETPVVNEPAAEKPEPKTEVALAPKPTPAPAAAEADAEGRPVLEDGTGGFAGVITFDGTAPPQTDLYAKGAAPKDPAVCGTVAIPDQSLVVNQENNGVENVFVYLRTKPKGYKGKPPEEAEVFDQKNCIFLPHNLVVFAGQEVLVKNGDPIVHNTHTNPVRNPGFNSAIGADDRVGVKLLYRRPEPFPVKVVCDLHAWMSAYHLVLDHPYCASTDENGKFAIANLPPGDYEFTVWQEKSGYLNKSLKVSIKAGEYAKSPTPLKYTAKDFAQRSGPAPKTLVLNTGR